MDEQAKINELQSRIDVLESHLAAIREAARLLADEKDPNMAAIRLRFILAESSLDKEEEISV